MTHVPAPVASTRPFATWMRVVAVIMAVLVLPAAVAATALWTASMHNDDPLAVIGLVLAVLLVVWTLIPGVLGVSSLVVAEKHPVAASGLMWTALGWHGLWVLLAGVVSAGFAV